MYINSTHRSYLYGLTQTTTTALKQHRELFLVFTILLHRCITISMEIDNPFETLQVHLFPRLERAGAWIASRLSILPSESELCLTEHRGASEMLDEALDQQLELEL